MNPFQRLRQTIDKVNITYQFPQDEQEIEAKTTSANGYNANLQRQVSVSNAEQIQRIKEICQNQQLSSIRQMTQLAAKTESLEKNLKKSQGVIENQIAQIVELEKENQQLKANLNQQYSTVVLCDDKERKYKQEIHRINSTINELAIEIQSERNAKKQLLKENESLKEKLQVKNFELQQFKAAAEKQKNKLTNQLEQRIAMFEYNVKKSSEDRRQFKMMLQSAQDNSKNALQASKSEIEKLRHELMDAKRSIEVEVVQRKNLEQNLRREREELLQLREVNQQLNSDLNKYKEKISKSERDHQQLEKNLSSIGSELAEQKKNVKIKMYKRQCKQLLQERYLLRTAGLTYQGNLQHEFKIIRSQDSNSV